MKTPCEISRLAPTVGAVFLTAIAACASGASEPFEQPDAAGADASESLDSTMPSPAIDASSTPPPALWVLTHDGAVNRLTRVDPITLAVQTTSVLAYAGVLWELAGTTPTVGYAIDRTADVLVTIDLESGSISGTTQLAGDMHVNGRGFGAWEGTLYGIFNGSLRTIAPGSGALGSPLTLQLGTQAESLESCDGQLYITSREASGPRGEKLYAINPVTGTATLRGTIGSTPIDIDTLACLAARLYGVDTDPVLGRTLYTIDPATGSPIAANVLAVSSDINGVHITSHTIE
ncbi:MAG: hypothetical protein ACKV2T_03185 [Kofleriaceae bacterium]